MKMPFGTKTIVAAVLIAFISAFFGYVSGTRTGMVRKEDAPMKTEMKDTLDVVRNETNVSVKEQLSPKKYILREKEGKIALILSEPDGKENVYKTYDINIKTLPEADRTKLGEGIEAESLSEALMLVEDYIE